MARTAVDLSLAELERILSDRKIQVAELEKRREKLLKELSKVESELQAILGKRGKSLRRVGVRGPRVKNERSLREHIVEVLSKSKKGYVLTDIAAKVLEAGYKSNSKNFNNMIYQCLYNTDGIKHDLETDCYLLVK